MAQLSVVDRNKAPAPPVKQSARQQNAMRLYESYFQGIKKGQAGRLVLTEPETTRGVAHRVSRAAKRLGLTVETWAAEGAVYFARR